MPDTMTDALLDRYAALEPRLPEGWPRLWSNPYWISKCGGRWCVGSGTECGRDLSDLERLGLAVLVLDAFYRDLAKGGMPTPRFYVPDEEMIETAITALETAYPKETTP